MKQFLNFKLLGGAAAFTGAYAVINSVFWGILISEGG